MKETLTLGWVYFLLEMKNFDRIINSFEVHIKSKFENRFIFGLFFVALRSKQNSTYSAGQ